MILQMVVMVWLVYAVLESTGNTDLISFAMILGGIAQTISVAGTGSGLGGAMTSDEKIVGTGTNPNSLAFIMVWCAASALLFWNSNGKWVRTRKTVVIVLVSISVYVLLASGSRKSTLAMGLLLFMWVTVGRGEATKGIKGLILPAIMGILLVIAAMSFAQEFTEKTPAGRRFVQFSSQGQGDIGSAVEDDARYEMYIEGLKISAEHPIFGVGVNNFGKYYHLGCYSHSNYMEPLATTGLIGFLLFQSFYFILIMRIRGLLRNRLDFVVRYRLKVFLMTMIVICVIGIGAPHYSNAPVYLIMTAISVYTYRLQRNGLMPANAMRVSSV